MPEHEFIGEERLVAIRPSGEIVDVVAAIGRPHQVGPEEWACAASVAGLESRAWEQHGGSSLQALCLAVMYVRQWLMHFVETGGRLRYPGSSSEFDIAASFGTTDLLRR